MQLLTKDSNAKIKKTNKVTSAHYEFYNLTLTSKVITKKMVQLSTLALMLIFLVVEKTV